MLTMTSREAEHDFTKLLDTSQREPVMITRQGRPISMVISPCADLKSAFTQFMQIVRAIAPLDGVDAVHEFDRIVANQGKRADGLTEAEIAAWVHESR
ncbi:MAG: hypothetical protein EPN21_20110 [Methylococcaceae bacterium]|nr:MAG: hypothetical protein EPN21_20110 [Methylococcaceae bacterium]